MFGDARQRACPADGATRDLFQPDEQEPLRILLVCPTCGTWSILTGTANTRRPWLITWAEQATLFAPEPVPTAG